MAFDALFVLNSILFGIGLAMDAFSVSIANGLNEPEMPVSRGLVIAGTFAVFQTVMPLLGWFCIHSIEETFQAFQPWIPWIALGLLVFIGCRGSRRPLTRCRSGSRSRNTRRRWR